VNFYSFSPGQWQVFSWYFFCNNINFFRFGKSVADYSKISIIKSLRGGLPLEVHMQFYVMQKALVRGKSMEDVV